MKTRYGRLAIAFGALTVALTFVPNCAAECGGSPQAKALHRSSWMFQPEEIRLIPAAFRPDDDENSGREPSIVGLWHVKFVSKGSTGIPDGTEVDAGYSQWHSDGTEILNSGAQPPDTSNFCLGVWEQVGHREYELNHYAVSWDASANKLVGPAHIRENVTLEPEGKKFSGTFTIDQYDEKLNVLAHVTGEITGTRITVKTPPQSIF
jgi:hypothetical protein